MMKEQGLQFGVHNHDYEFDREFDGQTPHAILAENAPDLVFQIDTYWVAVGGKDPVAVIQNLGPRAPVLHIKDGPLTREAAMTAVGDGTMDWAPIVDAADPDACRYLIVELDRCDTDMFEAVAKSLEYLVDNGFAARR
jgi:sugar phosphate isomerase/epimerase